MRRASRIETAAWMAGAVVVTAALVLARATVQPVHVAIAFLLLILGASARCGRRAGFALAGLCFLAFNFFFVRPYGTFQVHDPLDWWVLLGFLVTGAVAAELLHRAQAATASAELRIGELHRLARLGGEALHAAQAEDAAAAIARVLREETGVESCELYLQQPDDTHLRLVASSSDPALGAAATQPGSMVSVQALLVEADARSLIVPLHVRGRQQGLLALRSSRVIPPDLAALPFTRALAQYAALGLERVALSSAAAHAEALREADRLKDAVLSAVSHDLRTPLTAIKATAREIATSGDDRGEIIEGEADRLNRYVTNLLDLSRLEAGALPVELELVPVEDVMGALLQEVSPLAAGRDLRVRLEGEDALLVGRMDFVLTLRALANLVENALRHSPRDAAVGVSARRDGAHLRLEVADAGPGIEPSDRERIFEPFHQGKAERGSGAGLGLAIARRLVEAQGGALELAPRPGGGSLFTIVLPIADLAGVPLESL